jgi:hypothetical protein
VKTRQRIHYVTSADGVRLAWADAGAGAPLVKASNWMTHLEDEWDSPVWRHWMRFFAGHFRFHPLRRAGLWHERLEHRRAIDRDVGR